MRGEYDIHQSPEGSPGSAAPATRGPTVTEAAKPISSKCRATTQNCKISTTGFLVPVQPKAGARGGRPRSRQAPSAYSPPEPGPPKRFFLPVDYQWLTTFNTN